MKEMLKYSTELTVGESVAKITNSDSTFSLLTGLVVTN